MNKARADMNLPTSMTRQETDPIRQGVPGDFVSLLSRHNLLPVSAEASSSAPAQTEATTVFGFEFLGGIVMVGDRRATAGNVIVTETVDKIIELDESSLLAIAGVPATAFEMARVLQSSFDYYRRSQLQPLSLPARVRSLARLIRENLPMTLQGVGVVVPLFAGLERRESDVVPRIFFYDPLGAQFQATGFAASGSGAPTIRSILTFQTRFADPAPRDLDRAGALRLALRLLTVAAEHDSATGGVRPRENLFATVKILSSDGIERVSIEDQAAALGD